MWSSCAVCVECARCSDRLVNEPTGRFPCALHWPFRSRVDLAAVSEPVVLERFQHSRPSVDVDAVVRVTLGSSRADRIGCCSVREPIRSARDTIRGDVLVEIEHRLRSRALACALDEAPRGVERKPVATDPSAWTNFENDRAGHDRRVGGGHG